MSGLVPNLDELREAAPAEPAASVLACFDVDTLGDARDRLRDFAATHDRPPHVPSVEGQPTP